MGDRPTYGFDWYSPSGIFSGWSGGDVPEDMKAHGWTAIPLDASSNTRQEP